MTTMNNSMTIYAQGLEQISRFGSGKLSTLTGDLIGPANLATWRAASLRFWRALGNWNSFQERNPSGSDASEMEECKRAVNNAAHDISSLLGPVNGLPWSNDFLICKGLAALLRVKTRVPVTAEARVAVAAVKEARDQVQWFEDHDWTMADVPQTEDGTSMGPEYWAAELERRMEEKKALEEQPDHFNKEVTLRTPATFQKQLDTLLSLVVVGRLAMTPAQVEAELEAIKQARKAANKARRQKRAQARKAQEAQSTQAQPTTAA